MEAKERMERFSLDDIYVGSRLRRIDREAVERLAESIGQIGLLVPVIVRIQKGPIVVDGEEAIDLPTLIAGAHRLAAMKLLGWKDTEAILVYDDDINAQLWEIDENWARSELTPAQTADHAVRRRILWEQKTGGTNCPTSLKDGRKAGPQHQKAFSADTSRKTGQSKRHVNRAVARGEKIAPDVLQGVQGTHLDKGVALDALAKMTHEQQREIIKTGVLPDYKTPNEASEERVERVWRSYNALSYEERRQFRDRLEDHEPAIFDRTEAAS